jgi:hypothetical protein
MQRDAEHSMPREQGERRVGKVSWVVPKDPNVTSRDPSCGRPYWSRSRVPPCPRHLLLGLNYDYTTLLAGVCAVSGLGLPRVSGPAVYVCERVCWIVGVLFPRSWISDKIPADSMGWVVYVLVSWGLRHGLGDIVQVDT